MVVTVLEDEGYAVVVCLTPLHAMSLLDRVGFDLVITDGFSSVPGAVFVNTADLIRSAGVTPVALFSAHTLDPELARAAGFPDLITKPFDLDTLVRQVKLLLGDLPGCGAPDPPQGGETWQLATGSAYSDRRGHRESDPSRQPAADGHPCAAVGTLGGAMSAVIRWSFFFWPLAC